jgi:hypothetical protein
MKRLAHSILGLVLLGGTMVSVVATSAVASSAQQESPLARPGQGDYPTDRCCMGFAYNHLENIIVMFGGTRQDLPDSNETWLGRREISGAFTWWMPTIVCLPQPLVCPPARHSTRMTYAGNNQVLLFGGVGLDDELNDTWTGVYDENNDRFTWTLECGIPSDPCPMSIRSSPGLTYSSGNNKVVLYGGSDTNRNELADTWVGSGNGATFTWEPTAKCPSCAPGARASAALVYKSGADADVVLFGGQVANPALTCPDAPGQGVCGDTWTFNGVNWDNATEDFPPDGLPRSGHRIVFDLHQSHRVLVMFGGFADPDFPNTVNNDVWIGQEVGGVYVWEEADRSLEWPSARCCVGLAYDVTNDTVIMFGGGGNLAGEQDELNDTWRGHGNTTFTWACLASCTRFNVGD